MYNNVTWYFSGVVGKAGVNKHCSESQLSPLVAMFILFD